MAVLFQKESRGEVQGREEQREAQSRCVEGAGKDAGTRLSARVREKHLTRQRTPSGWLPVPGSDGRAAMAGEGPDISEMCMSGVEVGVELDIRVLGGNCGSSNRPQIPLRDRSGKQFLQRRDGPRQARWRI